MTDKFNYEKYEDFLTDLYTPLTAIRVVSGLIFEKVNNDWDFFETNREQCEELISLVIAIKTVTDKILETRKMEIDSLEF